MRSNIVTAGKSVSVGPMDFSYRSKLHKTLLKASEDLHKILEEEKANPSDKSKARIDDALRPFNVHRFWSNSQIHTGYFKDEQVRRILYYLQSEQRTEILEKMQDVPQLLADCNQHSVAVALNACLAAWAFSDQLPDLQKTTIGFVVENTKPGFITRPWILKRLPEFLKEELYADVHKDILHVFAAYYPAILTKIFPDGSYKTLHEQVLPYMSPQQIGELLYGIAISEKTLCKDATVTDSTLAYLSDTAAKIGELNAKFIEDGKPGLDEAHISAFVSMFGSVLTSPGLTRSYSPKGLTDACGALLTFVSATMAPDSDYRKRVEYSTSSLALEQMTPMIARGETTEAMQFLTWQATSIGGQAQDLLGLAWKQELPENGTQMVTVIEGAEGKPVLATLVASQVKWTLEQAMTEVMGETNGGLSNGIPNPKQKFEKGVKLLPDFPAALNKRMTEIEGRKTSPRP